MDNRQGFWDQRWKENQTGWDIGEVSPAIKNYLESWKDKSISILIPGAGNAYEAEYLLLKSFKDITVLDIAPTLINKLKQKYFGNSALNLVHGDFFKHQGEYDLIIEQTFFCAIDPVLRDDYVKKMSQLLKPKGRLIGVLFDRSFENGPPYGGAKEEYEQRFSPYFKIEKMERCTLSYPARVGTELWIELVKK